MIDQRKKIIVGVSGASGVILAKKFLESLKLLDAESHLVVSDSAVKTWEYETETDISSLISLADYFYEYKDIAANISSGTFKTDGMIIIPCSMKTVAGINSGYSENLLLRAADVTIKEKRKLMLLVREAPFSAIHLRNMYELSQMGVSILPMVMSYYSSPRSICDMENQLIGKALDYFGFDNNVLKRWSK